MTVPVAAAQINGRFGLRAFDPNQPTSGLVCGRSPAEHRTCRAFTEIAPTIALFELTELYLRPWLPCIDPEPEPGYESEPGYEIGDFQLRYTDGDQDTWSSIKSSPYNVRAIRAM